MITAQHETHRTIIAPYQKVKTCEPCSTFKLVNNIKGHGILWSIY